MNPSARCLRCGAVLANHTSADFCPACLFGQAALELEAAKTGNADVAEEAHGAPTNAGTGGTEAFPRIRQFGDYELQEEIARGAMGVVYRARQVSLNRPVAVKMILAGQLANEAEVKRFRAEAEAAANLDHPNIVHIYEVGEHAGQHYFSMQLVDGQSLAARVGKAQGLMAPTEAVPLMLKVSRAVHYAHQRGLLHRDIKPGNILLDAHGEPYVADFGLAKRVEVDNSLSVSGEVLGTPSYMSPEQATGRNKQLTTAADIYSLGATLYYTLTGCPPFQAKTPLETMRQVIEEEPVPPSKILKTPGGRNASESDREPRFVPCGIDKDLETICLKCLEKDPARRYASADGLAADLERWSRGQPIAARPCTVRERLIKWGRRKPATAASLGALVVAVTLGSAGVLWQWREANIHARAERLQRGRAEAALTRMQMERAEEMLEGFSQGATGLAWLARVLRDDPSHPFAAQRVISVLTYRYAHLPLAEFSEVTCTGWSPDGQQLAIGRTDGMVSIWKANGESPVTSSPAHTGAVTQVRFSPKGDCLLSVGEDGNVRVWDSSSGRELFSPVQHPNRVAWAEFSPDGQKFVTATEGGHGRVWNSLNGSPITPWFIHEAGPTIARFSPDGRLLLTGTWDVSVRLWDSGTGQPVQGFPLLQVQVRTVSFSPDSRWVLASDGRLVRLWEAATGRAVGPPMAHPDLVRWAEFSPDGHRVATTCADGVFRIWDAERSRLLLQWPAGRDPHRLPSPEVAWTRKLLDPRRWPPCWNKSIEYVPDGQSIVAAHDEYLVSVYDVRTGRRLGDSIFHEQPVRSVDCSPDGTRLLTRSANGRARVWDRRPGQALPVTLPTGEPLVGARFSKDGQRLLTLTRSGRVRHWNTVSGVSQALEWSVGDIVQWADFSRDGARMATAASDHALRVWEVRTGQPIGKPLQSQGHVRYPCFSPNGSRLATCSANGLVYILEVETSTQLSLSAPGERGIRPVAFSPDGKRLLTTDGDGIARVWDACSGKPVSPSLPNGRAALSAEFTHDGERVVTASLDGSVRFWDPNSGQPLRPVLQHAGGVVALRLNSQETKAATVTADGALCLWDLRDGRMIFTSGLKANRIQDAQFAMDGSRVAVSDTAGAVRIRDVQTGLQVCEWVLRGPAMSTYCFSPDGQRLLIGLPAAVEIWGMPQWPSPAPEWLRCLAEAVAGRRFNPLGELEPVPVQELLDIREQIQKSVSTDAYTQWAKWFFEDRSSRRQSPEGVVPFAEHVQSLIDQNTEASLREALFLSPTNCVAFGRLAQVLRATNTNGNPLIAAEAEWCERKASEPASP